MFTKKYVVLAISVLISTEVSSYYSTSQTSQAVNEDINGMRMSSIQIEELAKNVTVKVLSGDNEGSGILIRRQGNSYFVLTNNHVLRNGGQNSVTTFDGRTYKASTVTAVKFDKIDLVLLRFTSSKDVYTIAKINPSSLSIGDQVYASGFPSLANVARKSSWKFTVGQVVYFAKPSLEDGYEIGYTNDIDKGMSGGPVIDSLGRVVGINGMHAYPLWGDPYMYENGVKPCLEQRKEMRKVSWAIPVTKFEKYIDSMKISEDSRLKNEAIPTMFSISVPFANLEMMLRAEMFNRCIPINSVANSK